MSGATQVFSRRPPHPANTPKRGGGQAAMGQGVLPGIAVLARDIARGLSDEDRLRPALQGRDEADRGRERVPADKGEQAAVAVQVLGAEQGQDQPAAKVVIAAAVQTKVEDDPIHSGGLGRVDHPGREGRQRFCPIVLDGIDLHIDGFPVRQDLEHKGLAGAPEIERLGSPETSLQVTQAGSGPSGKGSRTTVVVPASVFHGQGRPIDALRDPASLEDLREPRGTGGPPA